MSGTKLLALTAVFVLIGCGAAPSPIASGGSSSGSVSELSPGERMSAIKAQNARVVAHTHSVDAREAYAIYGARLARARRKKATTVEQLVAMQGYVEYLRAEWQHRRAAEQVAVSALHLARATLAAKHKLSGAGSEASWRKQLALDRAAMRVAQRRVDGELARSRVPDAWSLARRTSHNRASRLTQAIEFFEEMSAIIAGSTSNCRTMARGLERLFVRRAIMVSRLRDGADAPFQQIHRRHSKFRGRADVATQKMLRGIAACIRNNRVKDVLERLAPQRQP